jgi:eukaryotic-like serine/threonine-protein kinase
MVPGVEPGTLLGGTYRIVRRIGSGGMGEVYEATHERLAHRYAVKVLHPAVREHPEAMPRFMREAQVTSRLRHPGIVSVVDFNTLPAGGAYLVMEFLDGESLGKVLARSGPLPLRRVVDIVDQLSAALTAAHLEGVVHRDMHPQNVFIVPGTAGQSERIKILDFGISKIASISQRITGMAAVMGTPQYMSPEQAEGKTEELDAASDQFSLAAIVYEMLTGRQAFTGTTLASVAYQIVHTRPAPIHDFRPELPAELENVVGRGLAKNKRDRFPSVSELAVHLRWTATLPSRDVPPRPGSDAAAAVPIVADTEETTAVSALPSGMAAVLRESTPELKSSDGETTVGRPGRPLSDDTTARQPARRPVDDEMTVVDPNAGAGAAPQAERRALSEQPADGELTVMAESTVFGAPDRRRFAIGASVAGAALVIGAIIAGVVVRTRSPGAAGAGAAVATPAPGAPQARAVAAAPRPPAGHPPSPPPAQPPPPAPTAATPPAPPDLPPSAQAAPPESEPMPAADGAGAHRSVGRPHSHAGGARPSLTESTAPPRAAAASGPCQITVGTYPWSELWIDGADTGQHTPVLGKTIASGPHRLEFKRRDLKIDQIENVTVSDGREFRRQYDLHGAGIDD